MSWEKGTKLMVGESIDAELNVEVFGLYLGALAFIDQHRH